MENKIAIVIGATGLVGKHIVKYCLEHPNYSEVLVFTRRSTNIKHSKLKEHLIDFDQLEHVKDLIKGDDLFSAMGTTIKKAGSQDAQYKIDYTYPYQFAKYARENGIRNYGLVSSTGANPNSKIFYSRMKGEMDRDVLKLMFPKTVIARPSVIEGQRNEKRRGEAFGLMLMNFLKHIPPFAKYKPAPADEIAKCLVKALNDETIKDQKIFTWDEVMNYARD